MHYHVVCCVESAVRIFKQSVVQCPVSLGILSLNKSQRWVGQKLCAIPWGRVRCANIQAAKLEALQSVVLCPSGILSVNKSQVVSWSVCSWKFYRVWCMSTVQYLQVRGNLKNSGSQGVSWPVSCRPVSEDLQQAKCPGRLATFKRTSHTNIYTHLHMFTHLYIYADRYTQIQPDNHFCWSMIFKH